MPTGNNSVQVRNVKNSSGYPEDHASLDNEKTDGINGCKTPTPNEGNIDQRAESSDSQEGEGQVTEHLSLNSAGENGEQLQQENLSISLRLTETTDEKEGATESDASEPLTGSKYCSTVVTAMQKLILKLALLSPQHLGETSVHNGKKKIFEPILKLSCIVHDSLSV